MEISLIMMVDSEDGFDSSVEYNAGEDGSCE